MFLMFQFLIVQLKVLGGYANKSFFFVSIPYSTIKSSARKTSYNAL